MFGKIIVIHAVSIPHSSPLLEVSLGTRPGGVSPAHFIPFSHDGSGKMVKVWSFCPPGFLWWKLLWSPAIARYIGDRNVMITIRKLSAKLSKYILKNWTYFYLFISISRYLLSSSYARSAHAHRSALMGKPMNNAELCSSMLLPCC